MEKATRREFLKSAAGVTAGMAAMIGPKDGWAGANDRIRMACIGLHGRGKSHIKGFQETCGNVEVATLCDVDEHVLATRAKQFEQKYGKKPKTEWDMRRVLEDKSIDAVSFATPNHWHALGAIWACQHEKDVYVEKPASHNLWEGRKMIEASRKYNRIVQYGVQLRSSPAVQEAVEHLRKGTIGKVYMARGLCFRWRPSIGHKNPKPVPSYLHYNMWMGPGPKHPYTENIVHYNWHWTWDYGNGDIGNQGVHEMDMCIWGLGVQLPKEITTMGGMFLWDDDKQVPNVTVSCFKYPDVNKMVVFDVRPWCTNDEANTGGVGNIFYGEKGILVIDGYSKYSIFFGRNREPGPTRNEGGNHFANFIKAVRSRNREDQNADIVTGHYSAGLAHLGLISSRVKRQLQFDPQTEQMVGDEEANRLLKWGGRSPDFVIPETV